MQPDVALLSMTRSVDRSLYSQESIASAQAAYAGRCQVEETSIGDGRFLVRVIPSQGDSEVMRATILEFWNYALIKSCQEKMPCRGSNGTP